MIKVDLKEYSDIERMAIDEESSPYSSQAESDDLSEDEDTINDDEPTFTTQTVQLDDVSEDGSEFDDTDDDLDEELNEESEDDDEDSETPLSQEGGKNEEGKTTVSSNSSEGDDTDTDDEDEDDGLKRFDEEIKKQYLVDAHPESQMPSYEEVRALSKVVRDDSGRPCDPLHRTLPILSKYERARIIGIRATQLADGAQPLITINKPAISELVIAEMELEANKLPFIIRRPLITGGSEYWKLADLERVV